MRCFETVTDLAAGAETLRRRAYGVIEMVDGRFRRIGLRPFPKIMIGGMGRKTMRLVACYADSWNGIGTPEEIGRVLGLPRKKLPIIKKAIRIYNLTPQTDQADAGWSLGEMVMDDRARSPDEELVESDNLIHVMRQLETMDAREATVLRMRFGLDDNEPRTLKEIGETLGLTRERVRQIETEALGKLADSLNGPIELEAAGFGIVD